MEVVSNCQLHKSQRLFTLSHSRQMSTTSQGTVQGSLLVSWYLSVNKITLSSRAIFIKSCRIMHYCCGKNQLNVGVDPIRNGRMAAIFIFHYSM